MFAGLKQNHNVIREKDICPLFFDGADLRFKHSAIYHDQMNIIEHATVTTKQLLRILI